MVGVCIIHFYLLQVLYRKKIDSSNSMKTQVELCFLKLVFWYGKIIGQAEITSHHCYLFCFPSNVLWRQRGKLADSTVVCMEW